LLNGGNTAQVEAQILLAGQPQYQQLYIDLINMSPYVDEPQLIDLINNTGFAELALRNVLVANPHSGRSPEVMDALYNRDPAVSQQTITDVENGSQTITSKDVLESEMNILNQNIAENLQGLQYYYVTDSVYWDTDSLTNMFESRNEADYVFMLAEFYWQKGQTTSIATLLGNANPTWWSEQDVITQGSLTQMYGTLVGAVNNGERKDSLSTTTVNTLQNQYLQEPSAWVRQRLHSLLTPYNMQNNNYQ